MMLEWQAGEGRAGGGKKACTASRGRRRRGRRSWRRRKGCGRMACFVGVAGRAGGGVAVAAGCEGGEEGFDED